MLPFRVLVEHFVLLSKRLFIFCVIKVNESGLHYISEAWFR
jgi:hypothetical protein